MLHAVGTAAATEPKKVKSCDSQKYRAAKATNTNLDAQPTPKFPLNYSGER